MGRVYGLEEIAKLHELAEAHTFPELMRLYNQWAIANKFPARERNGLANKLHALGYSRTLKGNGEWKTAAEWERSLGLSKTNLFRWIDKGQLKASPAPHGKYTIISNHDLTVFAKAYPHRFKRVSREICLEIFGEEIAQRIENSKGLRAPIDYILDTETGTRYSSINQCRLDIGCRPCTIKNSPRFQIVYKENTMGEITPLPIKTEVIWQSTHKDKPIICRGTIASAAKTSKNKYGFYYRIHVWWKISQTLRGWVLNHQAQNCFRQVYPNIIHSCLDKVPSDLVHEVTGIHLPHFLDHPGEHLGKDFYSDLTEGKYKLTTSPPRPLKDEWNELRGLKAKERVNKIAEVHKISPFTAAQRLEVEGVRIPDQIYQQLVG